MRDPIHKRTCLATSVLAAFVCRCGDSRSSPSNVNGPDASSENRTQSMDATRAIDASDDSRDAGGDEDGRSLMDAASRDAGPVDKGHGVDGGSPSSNHLYSSFLGLDLEGLAQTPDPHWTHVALSPDERFVYVSGGVPGFSAGGVNYPNQGMLMVLERDSTTNSLNGVGMRF